MSDEAERVTVNAGSDWSLLAIVVLVIFCAGDPDLIDALVKYTMECRP